MITVEAESKIAFSIHVEHHAIKHCFCARHSFANDEAALLHPPLKLKRRFCRPSGPGQQQRGGKNGEVFHSALLSNCIVCFNEASGLA